MEKAIDILQDRIIYLTGQITLIQFAEIGELTKDIAITEYQKEIEEMHEAQEIIRRWV